MSATSPGRSVLPPEIRARKGSAPLVVLTAYSTPVARLVDAHCDIVLVGDSLGMVIYGMPSTLGVTMEMMILHGRAVVRGAQKAMPVIDMPFGSYEEGPAQAFRNAARLMAETGAPAVKLEGGQHMAETIAFLTARGGAGSSGRNVDQAGLGVGRAADDLDFLGPASGAVGPGFHPADAETVGVGVLDGQTTD